MNRHILTNNEVPDEKLAALFQTGDNSVNFTELNNRTHRSVEIKTFKKMNGTEHKTNETATKIPPWDGINNYWGWGRDLNRFYGAPTSTSSSAAVYIGYSPGMEVS